MAKNEGKPVHVPRRKRFSPKPIELASLTLLELRWIHRALGDGRTRHIETAPSYASHRAFMLYNQSDATRMRFLEFYWKEVVRSGRSSAHMVRVREDDSEDFVPPPDLEDDALARLRESVAARKERGGG